MPAEEAATDPSRERVAGLFAAGSADRLAALLPAFERLAEAFGETAEKAFGVKLALSFKEMATGLARDVLSELAFVGLTGIVRASPWDAILLVRLPRATLSTVADCLLGGDGFEPPAPQRPISIIDAKLACVFIEVLLKALGQVFSAATFALEDAVEHLELKAFARASEAIATASFELATGGWTGEVRVSLPQSILTHMRQALADPAAARAAEPDPGWAKRIKSEVARSHVTVTAVLDERPALLGEIAAFHVGDILELKATAHSQVHVECNGERLLRCEFGKAAGSYSLRVSEFVDRQQEFIDDILAVA